MTVYVAGTLGAMPNVVATDLETAVRMLSYWSIAPAVTAVVWTCEFIDSSVVDCDAILRWTCETDAADGSKLTLYIEAYEVDTPETVKAFAARHPPPD